MKNKKLLYLLVPLVLLLWSTIVFKIINQVNQSGDSNTPIYVEANCKPEKTEVDTFRLIAHYSDPFLDRDRIASEDYYTPSTNIRLNDLPKSLAPATVVTWPLIRYGGMILNKTNGNYVFLVEINKTNHLTRKGDQIGEVKITNVFKDSIIVMFKNQTKTILKENL
jgi:hypothetical protein